MRNIPVDEIELCLSQRLGLVEAMHQGLYLSRQFGIPVSVGIVR
jgi:hypothetical protein